MKLKKIVPKRANIGTPSVRLNGKIGQLIINASGVRKMGLKTGDLMEVFQDEDESQQWYLSPSRTKEGYILRGISGKGSLGLMFNNAHTIRQILQSNDWEEKSNENFRLAPQFTEIEGRPYYGILTSKKTGDK